ncbi:8-oxo-dGTP pyrophosphatase MutT (NUDIX family) [Hamadaea flava]|uniref:NUDIX hydrolase n=1 Tax=Hamadaea flava TaxID=1742688 RepID=A0ABV8LG91_9ACTN|nr:CoA pyrophosphatase [Hamadaea flava]MCP2326243.1 8-oxo-dGTP pyrophosphatase MutT (NUDIX family) [Hamadaea flava]
MTAPIPEWLKGLQERVAESRSADFSRWPLPEHGGREAAVLVLFGESEEHGPDVLLLQRAATMRNHAGQPAFPGGAADPGDGGPQQTALREANEEVGLDPASVTVLSELPPIWISVSDFVVTPVLAWWHSPHPVYAVQPAEVERVARLPLTELTDPANRLRIRHSSGYIGPAFSVGGLLVWGFTAGILTVLLDLGGWSRPWDTSRVENLPVG